MPNKSTAGNMEALIDAVKATCGQGGEKIKEAAVRLLAGAIWQTGPVVAGGSLWQADVRDDGSWSLVVNEMRIVEHTGIDGYRAYTVSSTVTDGEIADRFNARLASEVAVPADLHYVLCVRNS